MVQGVEELLGVRVSVLGLWVALIRKMRQCQLVTFLLLALLLQRVRVLAKRLELRELAHSQVMGFHHLLHGQSLGQAGLLPWDLQLGPVALEQE